MSLNEQTIKSLLLNKGVKPDYIDSLTRRHVRHINILNYSASEIIEDPNGIDVPVSKIVSTHRISGSMRSWWKNMFDTSTHNRSPRKWDNIQDIFQRETLAQFRHSLSHIAPPLESVIYYPELDVYAVHEGHHRTVWAILTNTPTLRTKSLSIQKFDQKAFEKRMTFLKKKRTLIKNIRILQKELIQLIRMMNFEYDGKIIGYSQVPLSWWEKSELKQLFNYDLVKDAEVYLNSLEYALNKIKKLNHYHGKYKWIPNKIRSKILIFHSEFSKERDSLVDLAKLYDKGWEPKL